MFHHGDKQLVENKILRHHSQGMGQQVCNWTDNARAAIGTSTPLDMMNEIILDGFKVKRNDRANYHPELMVGFPPKLLDIRGSMLLEIFPCDPTKM